MKKDLRDHLKLFDSLNVYCWIAGGAIYDYFNGNRPNDIDVFFKSLKDVKKAMELLRKKRFKLIIHRNVGGQFESPQGVKYDLLFLSKTPEHLFHNFFDYSVCCAAVDNKGNFFHHENYFEHCEKKEIHYVEHCPKQDIVKIKRLKKYLERDFSIDSKNLLLWLGKMSSDKKRLKKKSFNVKEIGYMKLCDNLKFKIIKTKLKK
jgi:3-dehydroquinate synthetase